MIQNPNLEPDSIVSFAPSVKLTEPEEYNTELKARLALAMGRWRLDIHDLEQLHRTNLLIPKRTEKYEQWKNCYITKLLLQHEFEANRKLIIDWRIKEIFSKLLIPLNECKLINLNKRGIDDRLEQEFERIRTQQSGQKDTKGFEAQVKIARDMEEENPDLKLKIFNKAGSATLTSTSHANEDRLSTFDLCIKTNKQEELEAKFYCVLDGHGGGFASEFCKKHLQEAIETCMSVFNPTGTDEGIFNALKIAPVLLDSMFAKELAKTESSIFIGTTLCIVMKVGDDLYVANTGDSRAILNTGDPDKVLQLSYDAKASDKYSQKVTTKRGGKIEPYFKDKSGLLRVNGILAMTRAIGDEKLRNVRTGEKAITPRSKVTKVDLKKECAENTHCSIIVATDGLWDIASSNQVGKTAYNLAKDGVLPYEIARTLVETARGCKSGDDISAIVVDLSEPDPISEYTVNLYTTS